VGKRLAARCFDHANHFHGRIRGGTGAISCAAKIVYHYFGTTLGKCQCVRAPQAIACACNNRDSSFKINAHAKFPFLNKIIT